MRNISANSPWFSTRAVHVGPGSRGQPGHGTRTARQLGVALLDDLGKQPEAVSRHLRPEIREAAEMAGRGAVGDPGPAGQSAQREGLDALLCEKLERDLDQPLGKRGGRLRGEGTDHVDSVYSTQ